MYETRWVDTLDQLKDGSNIENSRVIAQNYHDTQGSHIPFKSPTKSKLGFGIALCIRGTLEKLFRSDSIKLVTDICD